MSAELSPSGNLTTSDKRPEETAQKLDILSQQSRTGFFTHCKTILKEILDTGSTNSDLKLMIHYKGTHLGFSVLGDKSIQYLRERLRPEDHYITVPLQNLPYYFTMWKRAFQSVWVEPQVHTAAEIAKLKEGIFPENKKLVDEILLFYQHVHMASFVFQPDKALELFNNYYLPKSNPQRRSPNYSELMLMCLTLATSLSLVIDKEVLCTYEPDECKLLREHSTVQLVKLQEEMFMNSVYYYHRISAVSEGIPSVQALLLMSIYLETSWVISDVNYTLVSLAIRYAQEMGLHIYELSANLPLVERVAQLKLWSACQCFDVEICYRLGKPPLLTNDDDKSERASQEFSRLVKEGFHLFNTDSNGCHSMQCMEMVGFFEVFQSLSKLRLVTYHTLFGSSLSFKSVNHVQDIVRTINAKSFALAAGIDESYRPKLYYEAGFDEFLQKMIDGSNLQNVFCLLLSMTYFSHLMTVNRVPWQVVVDESEVPARETPEFRRLSLDSARTILHLIRIVDKKSWPFITLNWMLIFPFLAAMNLCANCMNHASNKETFKDLSLLIDVSMNFFGFFCNICTEETKLHYMRFQLVDLLLRVVLRVIIKVIEERNNMSILDGNEDLRKHLESTEKNFPHIYKEDQSSFVRYYSEVPVEEFFSKQSNCYTDPEFVVPPLNPEPAQYAQVRTTLGLADILHPDFKSMDTTKLKEPLLDDDMSNMTFWTQEMLSMPNFFFDNGL